VKHLDFHFLNVGHGDCTFVDFPSGRLTMIDINNSKTFPTGDRDALAAHERISLDSFLHSGFFTGSSRENKYRRKLTDPVKYYRRHFSGRTVHRYIQSHPDMDHMGGLCDFFWREGVPLVNFWDTKNKKSFTKADFENSPHDWWDWWTYQRLGSGHLKDGAEHTVIHPLGGAEAESWADDGIAILSPDPAILTYCDRRQEWNNASFVLRIEFGGRAVVLPGDAEKPAWDVIEASVGGAGLKCDALKAAHHGRESGYSESAVAAMSPSVVICSVGLKPDTDASDKYQRTGATVLSTRYHGTIRVRLYESGRMVVKSSEDIVLKKLRPLESSWLFE
jgi:beta-lactamase superfamily II metal-dependent hydrolase